MIRFKNHCHYALLRRVYMLIKSKRGSGFILRDIRNNNVDTTRENLLAILATLQFLGVVEMRKSNTGVKKYYAVVSVKQ